MTSSVFQRIWEENKRFLLMVGGGLLTFLICRSCMIYPYELRATGDKGTITKNFEREEKIKRLLKPVRERFEAERNRLDDYKKIEEDLLARFAIRLPKDFAPTQPGKAKEVVFTQKIDSIWGEVHPKARNVNCKLPQKISIRELGVRPDDTDLVLRSHALYLEVIRRALHAMVDGGIREIDSPRFLDEAVCGIRENPEKSIVFQKVVFKVRGSYESYVETLRNCQKPGNYLQAIILDLDPRRAGPGLVNGRIEFSGFGLEDVVEAVKG